MCLIVYRESGRGINFDMMKSFWDKNPDGAGYWIENKSGKTVRFEKGFMDFNSFVASIKKSKLSRHDRYAIHFRWATHGGIRPDLCHPFPIDGQWDDISGTASKIMMHNGVIQIAPTGGRSDTAEYVVKKMKKKRNLSSEKNINQFEQETSPGRLLIYDSGKVNMTGQWFRRDGYFFSNYSGVTIYENSRDS